MPVRAVGDGVALAIAARLLRSKGYDVVGSDRAGRSGAPVVMLSATALSLLRDICEQLDLFARQPPITRRIVAWGQADPVAMPHAAVVVGGAELARQVPMPWASRQQDAPLFTILSKPPFPEASERRFGRRPATGTSVVLASAADGQACLVEATAQGWLFLIPSGPGEAWLLAVGATPDVLLGHSRLVAPHVATISPIAGQFETAPRMLETLAGDDWLACGSDALAFDPICGDGTAQAAREGILAAAVIAGIHDGGDRAALLGHYRAMLLAAMRRHLQIALPFYRSGGGSSWWQEQAEATAQGYAWCTARLGTLPEPRFVLQGTRLVPRELAA